MKSLLLVALEAWQTVSFAQMWLADSILEQMGEQ